MGTKFKLFRNSKLISLLTKKNDKTINSGDLIYGLEFVDKEHGAQSPYNDNKPHIHFYKKIINNNGDEVEMGSSEININSTAQGSLSGKDTEEALISYLSNSTSQIPIADTISNAMRVRIDYFSNTSGAQTVRDTYNMFNDIKTTYRNIDSNDPDYESLNAFGYLQAYKNSL